jgi:hypothetical protein
MTGISCGSRSTRLAGELDESQYHRVADRAEAA